MSGVHRLAVYASRSCAPKQWDLVQLDGMRMFASAIIKSRLQGVQLSLPDLGRDAPEQKESASVIKETGLGLIVDVISLPNTTAASCHDNLVDHIKTFESQLLSIDALGDVVTHINCCHSGDHRWDIATAAEYLGNVLPLSAQYLEDHAYIGRYGREVDIMGGSPPHLTGISHAAGVGILHSLEQTRELLEILPPLRMTMSAGIQHLVVGDNSDTNKDDALSTFKLEFVPHFDHIIADVAAEKGNEILWNQVWSRKAKRSVYEMSVTVNVPATIDINGCAENGELLPSEVLGLANDIRSSFDDWRAKK